MALDGLAVSAIIYELDKMLTGGRIDKIGTKDEIMPTLLGVETGCRYVKEDK